MRLACFRHAASVYPEPGSNSPSLMNRSSLSGTPPEEGAPKGIMCMFQPAPADHLAGSRALGAPTEVVYTPLRVPSLSLARFAQKPAPLGAASAPLCSCSGAVS